uniref:tRNA pseudouridine synthase D (TruD, PUS7) n=1 Tax=uncultured marine thaumarchaeote KM3_67_A06 TaxID=1456231 RepID=A0A075HCU2_9ARCH|nr:tRNA pseudouridine synthase D (truD, PUS7) [uncultured marine thaumarchaeote KM3_67_A06]
MIPKIDSDIGILTYTTDFPGCGGIVKKQNEDFIVSEIITEKTSSKICLESGFAVYKLQKNGIDTTHALNEILKKHGIRLKSLGLKDASAITEQFVFTTYKTNQHFEINESKYNLKKVGFTDKVLSKKEMIGNHFWIKIDGASDELTEFNEFDKILNFYGYQRFGSRRPVTHLIGRALIQKDFAGAIDLLLSFTSEYDRAENTKLRELMADKSRFPEALKILPKGMDLEKIALKEMIKHDDPVKTLRALPLSIRRFFVQSYQSYIFNQTLSMSLDAGEEMFFPHTDDVCYNKHGDLGKFENDSSQRLSIPFVGYSYYKKTRFHYYIEKILRNEGITHRDFFSKEMQEISSEGGFRNSSIKCDDYKAKDNVVSFSLSRGSFATIVLREIIKPENPLTSGF